MNRNVEVLRDLRAFCSKESGDGRLSSHARACNAEREVGLDAAILALEQSEQRARIADGPMCAYGCPTPSFMEAARAHGWAGDYPAGGGPYAAFDLAVQAGWREHVAVCPNHPQRKFEARVAELEAALYNLWAQDPCSAPCSVCGSEDGHLIGCIIATLPQVRG